MSAVQAKGIRLHYEIHGAGRQLVLMLGLAADV